METLIITHKTITDSVTLLKQLRRRFFVRIPRDIQNDENAINSFRLNVEKSIQLKVIKALRDWMKLYWDEDFSINYCEYGHEMHLNIGNMSKDIQYIMLLIIKALFDGFVQYNNTRPTSLINNGTVIHSNEIHEYLLKLDSSLQVKQWIIEQKICKNGKKDSQRIIDKIMSQLNVIRNTPNINGENISNSKSERTIINNQCATNVVNTINNNMNNMYNSSQIAITPHIPHISMITPCNINSFGGYRMYHRASYTVSDYRHTPYLSIPVINQSQYHDINSTIAYLPIIALFPATQYQ